MPHQCLGCGKSFPEGSTDLLKGCPGCSGTRFFYTEEVLDRAGLEEKRREAEADIRDLAEQMADEDIWSWRKRDEWVQFDSKKVSDALTMFSEARAKAVEAEGRGSAAPTVADYVAAHEADVEDEEATVTVADDAPAPVPESDAAKPAASPKPKAAELPKPPKGDAVHEEPAATSAAEAVSVRVDEPGNYDINVKSLLEANPVVIERDGVYMIHLASAFESAEKKRASTAEK